MFANAGNDIFTQDSVATSVFNSASVVNVYGQGGNDLITLGNVANIKASIFVSGGAGLHTIAVMNAGATTITGGVDSTDGADRITFNGVAGADGTSVIYGSAGDDVINVGGTGTGLDSTITATVYGGGGADSITIGSQAVNSQPLTVSGNDGADTFAIAKGADQAIKLTGVTDLVGLVGVTTVAA